MFKKDSTKVVPFITPHKGLKHWAVVLRSQPLYIVAGPFPVRELARLRQREISC